MPERVVLSRPETETDERGFTRHFFEILNTQGQSVGELTVREEPDDPTTAFIEDLFMFTDEPMPLGFQGVRDIGLRVKRFLPHIQRFRGARLSGAAFTGRDIEEELSEGIEPSRLTSVTVPRRFRVLD